MRESHTITSEGTAESSGSGSVRQGSQRFSIDRELDTNTPWNTTSDIGMRGYGEENEGMRG